MEKDSGRIRGTLRGNSRMIEMWIIAPAFYISVFPLVFIYMIVRDNAFNNHSLLDILVISLFWIILFPITLIVERREE